MNDLEAELGLASEEVRSREGETERLVAQGQELRQRLGERERQVAGLREELAGARARADEELRSLTMLGRQLEELRVTARGQATRIRLQALREAAALSARLGEAGAQGEAASDRLIEALEDAIDRVGAEWDAEEARSAAAAIPRSLGAPAGSTGREAANGGRRRVSVDVGPFEDFSQLVRFEDAANAIGATGDISIKRFSAGRARIDVALSEPVDLLRELEERCDLEFRVRSNADDELVLDVDAP